MIIVIHVSNVDHNFVIMHLQVDVLSIVEMVRNLFYNVMMVTITIMMVVVQNVRYNKDINVEVVLLIILIHVSSINLPK